MARLDGRGTAFPPDPQRRARPRDIPSTIVVPDGWRETSRGARGSDTRASALAARGQGGQPGAEVALLGHRHRLGQGLAPQAIDEMLAAGTDLG